MPIGLGRIGGVGVKAAPRIKGPHYGLPWRSPPLSRLAPSSTHQFDAARSVRPIAFADSRATVANYYSGKLAVATAPANSARIEIDVLTAAILGLFVEPAATNLVLQSSNMTNSSNWASGSSTLTALTGPFGNTGCVKVTSNGSTNSLVSLGLPAGPVSVTSGSNYTLTYDVQFINRRYVFLNYNNGTVPNTFFGAIFDIGGTADTTATQTFVGSSSGTVVSTKATYLGNSWFRISVTGNAALSSAGFAIGFADAATGNTPTSLGDINCTTANTDAFGTGRPQLELGTVVTSWISTTTVAVTRAADSYSFTLGAAQTSILFTFDDGSTQTVSGLTGGATYTIPTNLNRSHILYWDDPAAISENLTAAQTLGALVTAATDTVLAQAAIAQALGELGQAAAGTVLDQGVVAQTLGALSQAATAAGSTAVTWNPADTDSNILLSNGNLTATLNSGVTKKDTRATATATTGYFDTVWGLLQISGTGDNDGVGLGNLTESLTSYLGHTGGNSVGFYPGGQVFYNATLIGTGSVSFIQGDAVGVELTSTPSIKFYVNGVLSYEYTGTMPSGSLYPMLDLSNLPDSATTNFGASAMTFLPNGVKSWDQSQTGSASRSAVVAQTLGALGQTSTATVPLAIVIAQSLGALTQTLAATAIDSATAAQTLGAIVQTATDGVIDAATAAQTLGALAQAAAATVSPPAISVSQTLGALGQAATDAALDQAVVSQTLGTLIQAAAATHPDSVVVNQNLGILGQAATGAVVDIAAASQTLGAIVQTATGGVVDSATAAQTLGALTQAAAATHPVSAAAAQTLGALAQTATDTVTDAGVVAQALGALVQSTGGTVITTATVAQALGALVQVATATHPDTAAVSQALGTLGQVATVSAPIPGALQATQTLGALGQSLTGTVLDAAAVAQNLGAIGQSVAATLSDAAATAQTLGPLGQQVAATDPATAAVVQTLGAIVQATSGSLIDSVAVSQALGALNQTATAAGTSGFSAAQTLGAIVQALTGTVIDAATVTQALGGLGQAATGGVAVTAPARTDSLPALSQTATAGHVSFANVAQVLGTLSQIATAQGPGEADFLASQILGGLQQVAASNVPERLQATQALQALGQAVALRITPVAGVTIHGSAVKLQRGLGSLGQQTHLVGSLKQKPILVGKSRGRTILSGSTQ